MIVSPELRPANVRTGIRWEEPSCPLCGGDRQNPIIEASDPAPGGLGLRFAVVQCGECGLRFTSPRPDVSTIGQFYPPLYGPHQIGPAGNRRRRGLLDALRGRVVERRGMPWHGQRRLLDFGCGGGAYLARMQAQGWAVVGLDSSEETATRVRAEVGVPVFAGTLPHPALDPESFDVITMWQVLEHLHDPLAVLNEARRLLVPGGRLFVSVPNIDSTAFQWFGPNWLGLDLPRHLTHFTPPTLRRMIERVGFRVTKVRLVRHAKWMQSSALLANRNGQAPFWQRALTCKPLARLAAWGAYLAGSADSLMAAADVPAK